MSGYCGRLKAVCLFVCQPVCDVRYVSQRIGSIGWVTCATHSATATSSSFSSKRGFERHEQESGRCVFSEIRALQGAMLAAKNIYQDNDNQGNM